MTDTHLSDDIYTQVLLDAAHYPECSGTLVKPDLQTTATNASCGDEVTVQLQLSPDKKIITAVKWEGHGCIISQAHMDGLAQRVTGTAVSVVRSWTKADVLTIFGLHEITSGREKCLLLGLRAVQQALASLEK